MAGPIYIGNSPGVGAEAAAKWSRDNPLATWLASNPGKTKQDYETVVKYIWRAGSRVEGSLSDVTPVIYEDWMMANPGKTLQDYVNYLNSEYNKQAAGVTEEFNKSKQPGFMLDQTGRAVPDPNYTASGSTFLSSPQMNTLNNGWLPGETPPESLPPLTTETPTLQERFDRAWFEYTNPAPGHNPIDPRLDPQFQGLQPSGTATPVTNATGDWTITGAVPPPEWEYWYQNPQAAYLKQLSTGGLPTTGQFGNFLTDLFPNVYYNNLLRNLGTNASGQNQYQPFGSGQPQYSANPQDWSSFVNAPSGSIAYDWMGDTANRGTTYNMGLNTAKAQGLPYSMLSWLSGQNSNMANRYGALGMNPAMNYGNYLTDYLGIR